MKPADVQALIQRKMYKLQKIYKCTFFAVYTFFVGTANEKMYKSFTFFGKGRNWVTVSGYMPYRRKNVDTMTSS